MFIAVPNNNIHDINMNLKIYDFKMYTNKINFKAFKCYFYAKHFITRKNHRTIKFNNFFFHNKNISFFMDSMVHCFFEQIFSSNNKKRGKIYKVSLQNTYTLNTFTLKWMDLEIGTVLSIGYIILKLN